MTNRYPIPAGEIELDIEVKGSRFRATLDAARSVDSAHAFVEAIRQRYPGATHHCWAYVIGPPGATDRVGMSDDGEPRGTAGRPMLHVLTHSNIGDIVAVVTRWYGGTKLGTGGLIRAYSDTVQRALAVLPSVERIEWLLVSVVIGYAALEPLRRILPAHEAEILGEAFDTAVTLDLRLPVEREEAFAEAVIDMSKGTARIERAS